MQCYSIYANSEKKSQDAIDDIVLVKEGFNWSCFIFGSLWTLYKQVWSVLLIYFVVNVLCVLTIKFTPLTTTETEIIKIFISIIIASNANEYYGKSLLKRGYKFLGIAHGNSQEEAILRFFDKHNIENLYHLT